MTTLLRWLMPFLFVAILIIVISYNSSVQNATTRTTSEVDFLAETIAAGMIRGEVEESKDFQHFDKEELVSNMVATVAATQKNHGYDIDLEYIFLDEKGKVTEQEEKIQGIQFRVQLKDQSGTVKGTSEKRLALNYRE
ncbi:hypothetical protein [Pseudobacillus badius]|uniref:hypothetical protein n=1 Tax=Bacillus badius TaxID=1455 RepID=UPI0005979E92|nr:hypothetical protein [Bacillus badius]KIL74677.1 hypothetical protein SD78_1746 [Bacillus badius]UAT32409.1 hypothetical protein K7T73_09450 [Bacillus badius]GLY12882.1 hypothetical protein Bbad01_40980 [Bacillus badius]